MANTVVFSSATGHRILRAVERLERRQANLTSAARQRGKPATGVTGRNGFGSACPAFGLVSLTGYDASNFEYDYTRPGAAGLTEIGIAGSAISAAGTGAIWIDGVHPVLVSDYAGLSFGDRLGSQTDSWYAQADGSGPLVMMGNVPSSDQPGGLPAGVGLVRAFFRSKSLIVQGTSTLCSLDIVGGTKDVGKFQSKRRWTGTNTSVEQKRGLVQFKGPATGRFWMHATSGMAGKGIRCNTGGAGLVKGTPRLEVAPITEEFSLADDNYATLAALSVGTPVPCLSLYFISEPAGGDLISDPILDKGWLSGAFYHKVTAYGLRFQVPHVAMQTMTTTWLELLVYDVNSTSGYSLVIDT